ncbi:MAG: GGDEF domain-containing response regulator [Clostridia bacterium]|jgi:diguanylate cyclase (GGDEF)-like protein|nr:GGDEF domain-containing response regulator [Clostridia bacterium]
MGQDIYIIDDNIEFMNILTELFKNDKEYKLKNIKTQDIDLALKDIPSLIIINEEGIKKNILELCSQIRQNEDNSITPIVVLGENSDKKHRVEILKLCVEYYIVKPVDNDYIYYTIKNIVRLMYINRRVSPLTGLPGNVQIQTELKKRIIKKEEFAVLYFDLDNFKAYNDLYGFTKGDEIIKFTAKTIAKNISEANCKNSFVGHIGGDDFVALVSKTDYEAICKNVIKEFDKNVQEYFTKEDAKRGYLEVANRRGIIEQFPLTSISIGVVAVDKGRFDSILEIGEIGAQVKHIAKTKMGSAYIIDRRR